MRRSSRNLAQALVLGLAIVAGCCPGPPETPAASEPADAEHSVSPSASIPSTRQDPSSADVEPPTGCPPQAEREIWISYYLGGKRAGYVHTQVRREVVDGRKQVRIDWHHRLVARRAGQRVEMEIEHTSREMADGRLIDFTETQRSGPSTVRTRGRVENDRLILDTTSQGQTRTTTVPWSKSNGGLLAMEFSLFARPLKPGQTRAMRLRFPTLSEPVTMELAAARFEATPMPGGERRLLRVHCTVRSEDGSSYKGILWTDDRGDVLKTHLAAMQQETFRCSRAEALDESSLGEFDVTLAGVIAVDRPIPHPHDTRRIRYRVTFADGDPADAFVAGPSQQLKPLGDGAAELTVRSIRPDRPKQLVTPKADAPTPDDLAANSNIQSDDPRVQAMAREAVEGKNDAWSKAVALERCAHDAIRDVSFSYALASASEVARTREGDCTEHAVLLAAMARATGLPARVAIGLVYVEQPEGPRRVFGFHMWTEIYVGDRWIPMDATLGRGGVGAAHLKLAHSSMNDTAAMSPFVPVINLLGQQPKIEILEIN